MSQCRDEKFRFNAEMKLCHCKIACEIFRGSFRVRRAELNELEKLSIQCLSRNFNLNFNGNANFLNNCCAIYSFLIKNFQPSETIEMMMMCAKIKGWVALVQKF